MIDKAEFYRMASAAIRNDVTLGSMADIAGRDTLIMSLAAVIQEAYQLGFLAGQKTGDGVLQDVLDGIPNRNPFALMDDNAEEVEKLESRLEVLQAGIGHFSSHYRDRGDHSHDADIAEYAKRASEILDRLAVHRK